MNVEVCQKPYYLRLMEDKYHLSRKVKLSFDEALAHITAALKAEGFAVITSIDMKETFKKKISVHFRNYTILGVCNPRYAYEVLQEEDKMGVFLPCNVIVQQHENDEVEISTVNPEQMVATSDNLLLKTYATEIKAALQSALNHL